MKTAITILASIFMLNVANISAQVTYESTYSLPYYQYQFRIVNLGNNNYKYVVVDYLKGTSNFSF